MTKQRALPDSFGDALAGIFEVARTQKNMRIHLAAAAGVLITAGSSG